MNLKLSDNETAALERELRAIVEKTNIRSHGVIVTLKAILNKIRPGPERETLPPQRYYDSKGCHERSSRRLHRPGFSTLSKKYVTKLGR
jgi:hypothetical protein